MEETKQKLIEGARAKGICQQGYAHMREGDIEALVDYYVENPDWCLERDYPTYRFLRENFAEIEDKGVFVGKTFRGELLNERQAYIFHRCKGTIKVGLNLRKRLIPMLYLANGCKLRIVGVGEVKPSREQGRSRVPVYVYGDNDVSAKDNAYVRFVKTNREVGAWKQ